MQVSSGVAYGSLQGYAATLSEGTGYKQLVIATKISQPERVEQMMQVVDQRDLKKEFRVLELEVGGDYFSVIFHDNPGTMKKLRAFVDWFIPLLRQYGVPGIQYCPHCGQPVGSEGKWKLFDGVAIYVHESCAQSMLRGAEAEAEQQRLEDTGTYGGGVLGALLGAIVGAIPWAIVLQLGYVAAALGLLIGWLAKKGYELCHGKRGTGKLVIVILSCVVGVILGNLANDAITLAMMIQGGELPGFVYSDIPALMGALLQDSEYLRVTLAGLGQGLLFALLGTFGMFREMKREDKTQPAKMKNLE